MKIAEIVIIIIIIIPLLLNINVLIVVATIVFQYNRSTAMFVRGYLNKANTMKLSQGLNTLQQQ